MTTLAERIGRVGVWTSGVVARPSVEVRPALAEIESLGFKAIWYPESASKETMVLATLILGWTERLVVCPGIANLYARDPMAAINAARTLNEAYPGRYVLGLGVSHKPTVEGRGAEYLAPVPTMRRYLDGMAAAPYGGPQPPAEPEVVLAALGPLMLDLARDRSAGAHPYFSPVEHTAFARERLGPGKLLAPEVAVVLAGSRDEARERAGNYTSFYLSLPNYANNLRRLGYGDDDLAGAGSDRVFDALVAWGDVDAIAARVAAHLDAGADHVGVQVLAPHQFHLDALRSLAPTLLAL